MRTSTGGLQTWLANNAVAHRADLFTLTLADGTVYRWTNWERDLVSAGNTFLATAPGIAPLVRRGPFRQESALRVDALDVSINSDGYTVGGKSLGLLASQKWFFGARLNVDHVVMATPGDTSMTIPSWFEGRVSLASPHGPNVDLRVKSEMEALTVLLPRFKIQPSCGNVVYDPNCGLTKATYTLSGTVSAGTTTSCTTSTAGVTAKASGYFELGVLRFTSGALNGVRVAVQKWVTGSPGTFTFALPVSVAPAAGDTFTVYPGCDRQRNTCSSRFANLGNYRGYPYVPKAESGS